MKQSTRLVLLSLVLGSAHTIGALTNYLTTAPHSGRFGDQLVLYARAKLVSHVYGLPLLVRPFGYADQLILFTKDRKLTFSGTRRLRQQPLDCTAHLLAAAEKHAPATLYIANYFTRLDGINPEQYRQVAIMLRQLIRPRQRLDLVTPPPGVISIAVHVRRGGGYTLDRLARHIFRDKFMSNDYYIKTLRDIAKMFTGHALFAYIFTDDQEPLEIIRKFSQELEGENITFSCRDGTNSHDKNVLEDFFSMMTFDCLIRPSSSFSRMAELLGDHKVVISPSGIRFKESPATRLQKILSINPALYKISAIPSFFSKVWR